MANYTVHSTPKYHYHFNNRFGVGWWERRTDGHVTDLNTGSDAIEELHRIEPLAKGGEKNDAIFNNYGEEQSYSEYERL